MRLRSVPFTLLAVFFVRGAFAQHPAELAPTPPMGWNSWDSFGLTVTEAEFKANVDWLDHNLKRYGWQYLVVDEGWYLKNPQAKAGQFQFAMSQDGRYVPATNRFPSAANEAGFKPLADYVHRLGLRFGIHIIRGIPRQAVVEDLPIAGTSFHAADAADKSDICPWNADNYGVKANPAGQAYYDSVAKLYAEWGIDLVKVDCIAAHPYKGDEIRMISQALRKTGRPIVLSLSPGPGAFGQSERVVEGSTDVANFRRYLGSLGARSTNGVFAEYFAAVSGRGFLGALCGFRTLAGCRYVADRVPGSSPG